MKDNEYIEALESLLIFMCNWYESLTEECLQELVNKTNENYFKLPTIQYTHNRIAIENIAKLFEKRKPNVGFQEVYKIMLARMGNKND